MTVQSQFVASGTLCLIGEKFYTNNKVLVEAMVFLTIIYRCLVLASVSCKFCYQILVLRKSADKFRTRDKLEIVELEARDNCCPNQCVAPSIWAFQSSSKYHP